MAPRIVVGVDGSGESRAALRWAARQAEMTGAVLGAVMAWQTPALVYGAFATIAPNDLDFGTASAQVLATSMAEVAVDFPTVLVTTKVVEGPAALALLREAEGAELLVVGSRGHGAFTGMLLGSVSEHCVSHASCPVVVVRHDAAVVEAPDQAAVAGAIPLPAAPQPDAVPVA